MVENKKKDKVNNILRERLLLKLSCPIDADLNDDNIEEQIVLLCKKNDNDAKRYIIEKYEKIVNLKANSYFISGADREDIIQEGMVGLLKAINSFDSSKKIPFKYFADLCIKRQLITSIKTSTRQKHIPLNNYVSLDKPIKNDESEKSLMETLENIRVSNPEEIILLQEERERFRKMIDDILSPLEKKVIAMYMDGKSYQTISEELDQQLKSIDNAIQRSKRKMEKYINEQK